MKWTNHVICWNKCCSNNSNWNYKIFPLKQSMTKPYTYWILFNRKISMYMYGFVVHALHWSIIPSMEILLPLLHHHQQFYHQEYQNIYRMLVKEMWKMNEFILSCLFLYIWMIKIWFTFFCCGLNFRHGGYYSGSIFIFKNEIKEWLVCNAHCAYSVSKACCTLYNYIINQNSQLLFWNVELK